MSPLFVALPPADLPAHAYVPPTGVHATVMLAASAGKEHTVRSGETVYGIAATYKVSPEAIVRANDLANGGRWILPGHTLTIPSAKSGAQATSVSAPGTSASSSGTASGRTGGTITVRSGDTLSHLALKHGVSVSDLVSANSITNSRLIYPGQTLVLPGASTQASSSSSSSRSSSSSNSPNSSGTSSSSGSVTVRAGDTLYDLAAHHGVSVAALARANDLSDTRLIYPGQKLTLPGSSSAASASAATTTTSSTTSPSASSSSSSTSSAPKNLTRPYDQHNIGDLKIGETVPNTFLHYTYSNAVARAAAANREHLAAVDTPSRAQMRTMIEKTAKAHGVDPQLMVALSYQESGWNHSAVSTANAIGAMQVIPASGQWASALVGRELNLLDPQDNVTAGVVIMAALQASASSPEDAIGGYYQGLASVRQHGLFADTRSYVHNIQSLMKSL